MSENGDSLKRQASPDTETETETESETEIKEEFVNIVTKDVERCRIQRLDDLKSTIRDQVFLGQRRKPSNLKVFVIEGLNGQGKTTLSSEIQKLVQNSDPVPDTKVRFLKFPQLPGYSKTMFDTVNFDHETFQKQCREDMLEKYRNWCEEARNCPSEKFVYILDRFIISNQIYTSVYGPPNDNWLDGMVEHEFDVRYYYINLIRSEIDEAGCITSKIFLIFWGFLGTCSKFLLFTKEQKA